MPGKYFTLPCLVLLLLLSGCNNNGNAQNTAAYSKTTAHHIQKIEMETSYCEGTCPVFRLTVKADRTASFEAIAYNRKQGSFKGVLRERDYKKLISLLEDTGFENLQERYAVDVTDMSSFRMTIIYDDGKVKNIYDYGMEGTKALTDFYGFVFSLTDTQDWQ